MVIWPMSSLCIELIVEFACAMLMSSYCACVENSGKSILDLSDLPNQSTSCSFSKKSFGNKAVVEHSF